MRYAKKLKIFTIEVIVQGQYQINEFIRISMKQSFQVKDVVHISVHPSFNDINLYNDVALLHVKSEFTLDEANIGLMKLPTSKSKKFPLGVRERNCIATGWGRRGFGKIQKHLPELSFGLQVYDRERLNILAKIDFQTVLLLIT